MPSSLRSNVHPGSLNRLSVSVAAIGSTHPGIFTPAVYPAPLRRGGPLGPPEEERYNQMFASRPWRVPYVAAGFQTGFRTVEGGFQTAQRTTGEVPKWS